MVIRVKSKREMKVRVARIKVLTRALTGVGAGLLEWGVMSPSEAVYVCLLVFNQSGDGLASFSGAYRTRKSFG